MNKTHENLLCAWCSPLKAELTFRDLMVQTGMDPDAIADELRSPMVEHRWNGRELTYRPSAEAIRSIANQFLQPFTADEEAVPVNVIRLRIA